MIGDLLKATRLESAKLTIEPKRMNLTAAIKEVCSYTLFTRRRERDCASEPRRCDS